jgi:hypothetical protein
MMKLCGVERNAQKPGVPLITPADGKSAPPWTHWRRCFVRLGDPHAETVRFALRVKGLKISYRRVVDQEIRDAWPYCGILDFSKGISNSSTSLESRAYPNFNTRDDLQV